MTQLILKQAAQFQIWNPELESTLGIRLHPYNQRRLELTNEKNE